MAYLGCIQIKIENEQNAFECSKQGPVQTSIVQHFSLLSFLYIVVLCL